MDDIKYPPEDFEIAKVRIRKGDWDFPALAYYKLEGGEPYLYKVWIEATDTPREFDSNIEWQIIEQLKKVKYYE